MREVLGDDLIRGMNTASGYGFTYPCAIVQEVFGFEDLAKLLSRCAHEGMKWKTASFRN
jgi:hypothetical protein